MPLKASEILGKKVIDKRGNEIATTSDLIIENWQIRAIEISMGKIFKKKHQLDISEIESIGKYILPKRSLEEYTTL